MFYRFPGSDDIKTLPAGKPSPVITSWLPSGYYQLEGDQAGNYYIQDDPARVQIVPADAPDTSGIGSGLFSGVTDFFSNTTADISRTAGHLGEGFKESVSDVGSGLLGNLKTVLIVVGVLIGVFVFIKFYEIFK